MEEEKKTAAHVKVELAREQANLDEAQATVRTDKDCLDHDRDNFHLEETRVRQELGKR